MKTEPLKDTTLYNHLLNCYGGKMLETVELTKAEVYLRPDKDLLYPLNYRPLRGTALLDDTKVISGGAVAYAIADNGRYGVQPMAFVFDAEKLKQRGYLTRSRILGKEDAAEPDSVSPASSYKADDVLGVVKLPTSLACKVSEGSCRMRPRTKQDNREDSQSFPVRAHDMFLVGDKLVPAETWMHLHAKERYAHLALEAKRGIV
jgi:hypothetical protein